MSDPYVVLGVDPSASDETVKRAYRDLVKKYHPDSYQDNPLSELAEEKMKQVNEAYDAIIKARNGNGYSGASSWNGRSESRGGGSAFSQVRQMINYGNIDEARRLLEQSSERNAEWHYLMGTVFYYKGWLSEANDHFRTAVQRDPGNSEYRQAVNSMERQANRGFQSYQRGGVGTNDCCLPFLCGACLCNGCS